MGYALAGPNRLPHAEARPGDGELKRLYVDRAGQGVGAGKTLFDAATAWLESSGTRRIWLGVWSGNDRAQRFYARRGFATVGEYTFLVGETRDQELIMRRG